MQDCHLHGVTGSGSQQLCPSGQHWHARPTCTLLSSKGIVSRSEFPERGRGQITSLRHLLKQISLCHDQLGPVHLTAVGVEGKEKETTDVGLGRGRKAPRGSECLGTLASGSGDKAPCVSVCDPGPAHGPTGEGASHLGLAHLTQPQPNRPQSCKIRQRLVRQQRAIPSGSVSFRVMLFQLHPDSVPISLLGRQRCASWRL